MRDRRCDSSHPELRLFEARFSDITEQEIPCSGTMSATRRSSQVSARGAAADRVKARVARFPK